MTSSESAVEFTSNLPKAIGQPYEDLGKSASLASLIRHGGFQLLHSPSKMGPRIQKSFGYSDEKTSSIALGLQKTATLFFERLSDKHYAIPAELVSYISLPHEGKTYTEPADAELENKLVPAAFTFVGQFIDHDLTFNGLDLFDDQLTMEAPDLASPKLDLDSVYGRHYPKSFYKSGNAPTTNMNVFNNDGTFKLVKTDKNKYDLTRFSDARSPFRVDAAYISDPRNDENQLILQIHILITRVHNKIVAGETGSTEERIAKARVKVVEIWQSVILNDFLPKVCMPSVVATVRAAVKAAVVSGNYASLHFKPDAKGRLHMPHEFAIGFRFGHSMLRSAYKINSGDPIALFINRDLDNKGDLRGGKKLSANNHFIEVISFIRRQVRSRPRFRLIAT